MVMKAASDIERVRVGIRLSDLKYKGRVFIDPAYIVFTHSMSLMFALFETFSKIIKFLLRGVLRTGIITTWTTPFFTRKGQQMILWLSNSWNSLED